jgi:hypothetical protein
VSNDANDPSQTHAPMTNAEARTWALNLVARLRKLEQEVAEIKRTVAAQPPRPSARRSGRPAIAHSSNRGEVQAFWQQWLAVVARDLGSLLAQTIDVPPSEDRATRDIVTALVEIEQSLAP